MSNVVECRSGCCREVKLKLYLLSRINTSTSLWLIMQPRQVQHWRRDTAEASYSRGTWEGRKGNSDSEGVLIKLDEDSEWIVSVVGCIRRWACNAQSFWVYNAIQYSSICSAMHFPVHHQCIQLTLSPLLLLLRLYLCSSIDANWPALSATLKSLPNAQTKHPKLLRLKLFSRKGHNSHWTVNARINCFLHKQIAKQPFHFSSKTMEI